MSNEIIKEFANRQRMKSSEVVEEIQAPIFGLEKWRKEHGLTSPEMEAYIEAVREQKAFLVMGTLVITILVNFLRYGVP